LADAHAVNISKIGKIFILMSTIII
jgi:hypothetical protein